MLFEPTQSIAGSAVEGDSSTAWIPGCEPAAATNVDLSHLADHILIQSAVGGVSAPLNRGAGQWARIPDDFREASDGRCFESARFPSSVTSTPSYKVWHSIVLAPRVLASGGAEATAQRLVSREDPAMRFLDKVYRLDAANQLSDAADLVYDHLEQLLHEGAHEACDRILGMVEVDRFSTAMMRSFLTVTAPAKSKLKCRSELYARIEKAMISRTDPERTHRLLCRLD